MFTDSSVFLLPCRLLHHIICLRVGFCSPGDISLRMSEHHTVMTVSVYVYLHSTHCCRGPLAPSSMPRTTLRP